MKNLLPWTLVAILFVVSVVAIKHLEYAPENFVKELKHSAYNSHFIGCHTALMYSGFPQDDATQACTRMTDEYKEGLERYLERN